ncbi:rRNA maturation RNase YbeY [Pricia sp. S334]|uniref:Endoribonuclease YbeY n=1 Tax=Pricia mediterranea TaxID=3076079 RepID=A0ABU3L599_9FLAO|nr:rRNA maturation RNase YbeY [Pricia sp. S334]MDT7828905.1 rRNA maturation RNase YbeY [Pricia sp. S334]
MIEFHYETDFRLENDSNYADWINRIIASEGGLSKRIDYIFCTDAYLLEMNRKYLSHDTLTDIITFDYREGKQVGGDIFISIDRVKDNAQFYNVAWESELLRVMAHGVLHLFNYKDGSDVEKAEMRAKEEEKIKLFHVEQ